MELEGPDDGDAAIGVAEPAERPMVRNAGPAPEAGPEVAKAIEGPAAPAQTVEGIPEDLLDIAIQAAVGERVEVQAEPAAAPSLEAGGTAPATVLPTSGGSAGEAPVEPSHGVAAAPLEVTRLPRVPRATPEPSEPAEHPAEEHVVMRPYDPAEPQEAPSIEHAVVTPKPRKKRGGG